MKRKKKDYTPYPGFYDLRIFDLSPREFFAAWRVQEFLHNAAGRKRYYKTYAPRQWEELKELSALFANVPAAQAETKRRTQITKGDL